MIIACEKALSFGYRARMGQRKALSVAPFFPGTPNKFYFSLVSRPYWYSQYWTGTSLQWRLVWENILKIIFIWKDFTRISLHCKLVPVQYWEYECGLFKTASSCRQFELLILVARAFPCPKWLFHLRRSIEVNQKYLKLEKDVVCEISYNSRVRYRCMRTYRSDFLIRAIWETNVTRVIWVSGRIRWMSEF